MRMDPVKRRLEILETQLVSRPPLDILSERIPLLLPAMCLVLGIVIQSFMVWPKSVWLGLMIGSPAFLLSHRPHRFMLLACATTMALGSLRLITYTHLPSTDISYAVLDQETPATLTGRIISTPKLTRTDWEYASFYPTAPGQSFDLAVEGDYTGIVRVYAAEPIDPLTLGTRITLHGRVSRFSPAANPGQFDMAKHEARRNCFVTAFIKSPLSVEILPDAPPLWLRLLRVRSRTQHYIAQSFIKPDQDISANASLLQALLLGMRTDVPNSILQDFQTTGLLHLISLSGLHVGILVSMVWVIGQCLGLLKPGRSVLCLLVLAGFLWLVPLRSATMRAGLIAGLFCTAILLKRKPQPLNMLSLAALILLLIRPTQLFEAGWQLSFSSVLGILLISARLDTWSHQWLLAYCPIPKTRLWRILHHLLRSLLTLLAVGLGAWLGSLAILAYHFYSVTPFSVLYTLVALPLVTGILVFGFLHILCFLVCPFVTPLTLLILHGLCSGLIHIVHGLSQIPGSRLLIGHISWVPVSLYYALLLPGLLWKKRRMNVCLLAASIILPFVWIQWPRVWRDEAARLELTCLSVGHGQSLVLRAPNNHTYIFDAGSLYQKDIGRRIVSAYLDYKRLSKIDAIVVSHNDADHMNGIPEILQHCRVEHVYAPALLMDQAEKDQGPAPWLLQYLRKKQRRFEMLPTILKPCKDLTIQQLWPDSTTTTAHLSDNNASLVLLVTYQSRTILLTSDIEQSTQNCLIERYPNLHPDILLAPHHGSLNTLEGHFLERIAAKTILCSCSRQSFERNRVINTSTTYHTPIQGAITLQMDEQGKIKTEFTLGL